MKNRMQNNSTARSSGRTVIRANQTTTTVNSKRKLLLASIGTLLLALLAPAAHAAILQYDAFLSGPNESPANASPGIGFATVSPHGEIEAVDERALLGCGEPEGAGRHEAQLPALGVA